MDTKHGAVDQCVGPQAFSWARFAVMMALIGTPCIACACLFVRQLTPVREESVPAAVQAESRPVVIVIPSSPAVAQRNCVQEASPTPAPSQVTTSPSPSTTKPVVQSVSQASTAPQIVQPPSSPTPGTPTGEGPAEQPVATADAKAGAAGKPAMLAGSVLLTAASYPPEPERPQLPPLPQLPPVPQPPPLPSPGEVASVPAGPQAYLPAPDGVQPPPPSPSLTIPAPVSRTQDAKKPLPLPDAVQPLPPSPALVFPASGTGPQDANKSLQPNAALEMPAPNMLPISMPTNHPTPSSAWSRPVDMPQPTEQELEAIRNHIEGVVDPNCILDLVQGRTRLLKLKKPARTVQVSGTDVISWTPLNGREIAIQARTVGTTLLHLTFDDSDKAHDVEIRYLVRVFPELTAREPYEAIFRTLEAKIADLFADSKVQLKLVGEAVLVTGQVRDARDAATIVQLVVANTPWADRHAAGTGDPRAVAATGSPHVINQLQIARAASHQVKLKVAVVELSRSAFWSLCGNGTVVHGLGGSPDATRSTGAIVPVVYEFSDGRMSAAWSAKAVSGVKLASATDGLPMPEPRQVVLHGQPATVVASGHCLVTASPDKAPAEQRSVTLGLRGIELSFTPVCVAGEPLRMAVDANAAPSGTDRLGHSMFAVRDGQTVAFAGLLPSAAQERDSRRIAGRWTIFGRLSGMEQPTAFMRETIILIQPEAAGAH